MTETPLLSICIPTYNRSDSLKKLLRSIELNLDNKLKSQTEIIVSDNQSIDNTCNIVKEFLLEIGVRYFKNDNNIGAPANILKVTTYATGDYIWIVGDDDLFTPTAIHDIIEIIKRRPNESCIITGFSYEDTSNKDYILSAQDEIEFSSPIFLDTTLEMSLNKWEDSFLYSKVAALHTSIVSCVFRREPWEIELLKTKNWQLSNSLTSLESTFPHTVIWANMFVGKPVYFVSKPMVYFFVGEQEWFKPKWGTIMFSFCLELAQEFRLLGADEEKVKYYEDRILEKYQIFLSLLTEKSGYVNEHFCIEWLLSVYGHHSTLQKTILLAINSKSISNRIKLRLHGLILLKTLKFPSLLKYSFSVLRSLLILISIFFFQRLNRLATTKIYFG